MSRKIKKLYNIFVLLSVLVGIIVLNDNYVANHFGYALLGALLVTASVFGFITKTSFLGSAYIVPERSESLLFSSIDKIINSLAGLAGVFLILYNIYELLS
ncbi:MAG: hypothetical protein CVU89_12490 [Firmicutes bacterium HGW-Firmicutes-14]|nr:MAG: hypothetical protein CVU89_12490 [Firmicutes bacterium HGW-Firmicutes-14]